MDKAKENKKRGRELNFINPKTGKEHIDFNLPCPECGSGLYQGGQVPFKGEDGGLYHSDRAKCYKCNKGFYIWGDNTEFQPWKQECKCIIDPTTEARIKHLLEKRKPNSEAQQKIYLKQQVLKEKLTPLYKIEENIDDEIYDLVGSGKIAIKAIRGKLF